VRLDAITIILDQWDVLRLHFQIAAGSERCYSAQQLFKIYNDPQMKLYLLCMRKVLNEVISVNKAFQASNADVTKLTRDLLQLYKSLMQMIVLPAAMAQLNSTDVVTFAFKDHLACIMHSPWI